MLPDPPPPTPPRMRPYHAAVVALCLIFGTMISVIVAGTLMSPRSMTVDPTTVPAGRGYSTFVTNGVPRSTTPCQSIWDWITGERDPYCGASIDEGVSVITGLAATAVTLFSAAYFILSLARDPELPPPPESSRTPRVRGEPPLPRAAHTARSRGVTITIEVVVSVLGVVALAATAAAAIRQPDEMVRPIGIVAAILIFGSLATRRYAQPNDEHRYPALPSGPDQLWHLGFVDALLSHPVIVSWQATDAMTDLQHRLGAHLELLGPHTSSADSWFSFQARGEDSWLVIVTLRSPGIRGQQSTRMDAVMRVRSGRARLEGWLRPDPGARFGAVVMVAYGLGLIVLGLRTPGTGWGLIAISAFVAAWWFTLVRMTRSKANAAVAFLGEVLAAPVFTRPAPRTAPRTEHSDDERRWRRTTLLTPDRAEQVRLVRRFALAVAALYLSLASLNILVR